MKETRNKILYISVFLLFFINIVAWLAVYDLSRVQYLEVTFFNVGQGDSIFIETPNNNQILIDGGPNSIILQKLSEEMPFYDRTIDLIILTHPEKDHLAGLLEILKKYKVENILWTGVVRKTPEWEEWERLIKNEGANIEIAKIGQRIILEETPDIFIDILNPSENFAGLELGDSNDTSVVSRLVFENKSFLLTGDITIKVEQELINRDIYLDSDVLKVAHHGSKTSTSPEFLEKVSPDIGIIQVGKNNYGHPQPSVLANLGQFGIQILRTDINGDIKIISDGTNLKNIK